MLIKELIDKIEELIPIDLQESWDNSGLQVGSYDDHLNGVLVCVDVNDEVIDMAREVGANLIIAHHPILFRETKSIDSNNFISRKIIKAIKNNITIYACHTNIDVYKNGLNTYVFKALGFRTFGKLVDMEDGHGYGDVTEIPSRNVIHLADQIKERLELDHIIFYGDEDREVSKIALATGSGDSFLQECVEKGIELYITSDFKHHEAMDALEQGVMIMDLGHYQSEKLFCNLMKELIEKFRLDIPVSIAEQDEKYKRNII